jgi:hypothetical protein
MRRLAFPLGAKRVFPKKRNAFWRSFFNYAKYFLTKAISRSESLAP